MAAKILIVDDDAATRGGLTELLRHAGYDPRPFGTYTEARLALDSERPDLLISDLRLDGFNGLQLVALSPRPVPAIIVTGFPDRVLESEARRLGAEYLVKPVLPATLLRLIQQRLAAAAARAADVEGDTRRWTRKTVPHGIDGLVENQVARLLDISYGGIRFVTLTPDTAPLPATVRLVLPTPPAAVDLDVVWTSPDGEGRLYGAAVPDDADPHWRRLVDTIDSLQT